MQLPRDMTPRDWFAGQVLAGLVAYAPRSSGSRCASIEDLDCWEESAKECDITFPIDLLLTDDDEFDAWSRAQYEAARKREADHREHLRRERERDELATFKRLKQKFEPAA
jgi:hypothetical protein